MGRGNSHDDSEQVRRSSPDLEAIAERARQLLPKYGGFISGAVNQAFILAGYAASIEEQRKVEQMLETAPAAPRKRLCRIFLDGVESWARETDGSLEDVLRALVSECPDAQWIVVEDAQAPGNRVAFDRTSGDYLL